MTSLNAVYRTSVLQ